MSKQEALQAIEAMRDEQEPRAVAVSFDAASRTIMVQLKGGAFFGFPIERFEPLRDASDGDLAAVSVSPSGEGLDWERLDVQAYVPGLLLTVTGTDAWRKRLAAAEWASLAGSSTSEAKREAARANGKKGGRPSKPSLIHDAGKRPNTGVGANPRPIVKPSDRQKKATS